MSPNLNPFQSRLRNRSGLSLVALSLILALAMGCSSSESPDSGPTATVFLTPSGPPTVTPTFVATPTTVAIPTSVPATVFPTATAQSASSGVGSGLDSQEPTSTPSPLGAEFFLTLIEPSEVDVFATNSLLKVAGRTRVDAVVTVNDDIVAPDSDGLFEHAVELEEGINIIEVVGSVSSEEQANYVITAVYLP